MENNFFKDLLDNHLLIEIRKKELDDSRNTTNTLISFAESTDDIFIQKEALKLSKDVINALTDLTIQILQALDDSTIELVGNTIKDLLNLNEKDEE